jgi:RNA polymerase sigma-70 factor (sigma-E family)
VGVTEREGQFREFFEAEYRPLRRLAYLLTGNWNEAEDLTQDAMLRTYRAWGRIRERERPGAYARTVMINTHRSAIRRLMVARRHAHEVDDAAAAAFDEDGVTVWAALMRLPDRQRAAIALRFYEDLADAEIAVILACPVGTVKSWIHRGLERMRSTLGDDYQVGEVS